MVKVYHHVLKKLVAAKIVKKLMGCHILRRIESLLLMSVKSRSL